MTARLFDAPAFAGLDTHGARLVNDRLAGALVRYRTRSQAADGHEPRLGTLLGVLDSGLTREEQWLAQHASVWPAHGDVVICEDEWGLGGCTLICHRNDLETLDVLLPERWTCAQCDRYDTLDHLVEIEQGERLVDAHPYDCVEYESAAEYERAMTPPPPRPRTLTERMGWPRRIVRSVVA